METHDHQTLNPSVTAEVPFKFSAVHMRIHYSMEHRLGTQICDLIARYTVAFIDETLLKQSKLLGKGTHGDVYTFSSDSSIAVKRSTQCDWTTAFNSVYRELAVLGATCETGHNLIRPIDIQFEMDAKEEKCAFSFILTRYEADLWIRHATKGSPVPAVFRSLSRQLVHATSHLHMLCISHRDIKPANILYADQDDEPQIVLSDYGLARRCTQYSFFDHRPNRPQDKMSRNTSWVQTHGFRAPEIWSQFDYQPFMYYYDAKAIDVWSIGATLLSLLSPFSPIMLAAPDRMVSISEENRFFLENELMRIHERFSFGSNYISEIVSRYYAGTNREEQKDLCVFSFEYVATGIQQTKYMLSIVDAPIFTKTPIFTKKP